MFLDVGLRSRFTHQGFFEGHAHPQIHSRIGATRRKRSKRDSSHNAP